MAEEGSNLKLMWTTGLFLTSDRDMETAETNMQTALNGVEKWTRQKGFKISPEITVCMYICRKRTHNHQDPETQLNGRRLEIEDTHKILGLTFDSRLTWKAHINETRAKAFRRINLLMLLRVYEMMVLLALEYGSAAYGSASNAQLKRHNEGIENITWRFLRVQN
jgi:hypothetical protein